MKKKEAPALPEINGTGWPCLSFIRFPIYRRIGLGKDVRITSEGITLRVMNYGKVRFIHLSWEDLASKGPVFPCPRKKDIYGAKAARRKKV